MTTQPQSPGVSAVICCHNSAQTIAETVSALAGQRVPAGTAYEVILVDNACTDDTVARAREAWNGNPFPLRIVPEPDPGLVFARRTGAGAARHGIVLFIDDDNILAPEWVEKLPAIFAAHPRVGAVGGCNSPRFAGDRPSWFDDFAGAYACRRVQEHSGTPEHRPALVGAGLAFRAPLLREIFSALPMLLVGHRGTETSRGEDTELCLRARLMGWELWYDHSLRLLHNLKQERLNWRYVLEARYQGGRAAVVLNIYRDLVAGSPPRTYERADSGLRHRWTRFWESLPSCGELAREGSPVAVRFRQLLGATDGLNALGPTGYEEIVAQLQGAFPPPAGRRPA